MPFFNSIYSFCFDRLSEIWVFFAIFEAIFSFSSEKSPGNKSLGEFSLQFFNSPSKNCSKEFLPFFNTIFLLYFGRLPQKIIVPFFNPTFFHFFLQKLPKKIHTVIFQHNLLIFPKKKLCEEKYFVIFHAIIFKFLSTNGPKKLISPFFNTIFSLSLE